MKNRVFIVAFFLTMVFCATANADLKDRLIPITSGKENIAVDAFIVGTQDRYIATVVRDLTEETLHDLGDTARDVAALHGNKGLSLVEKLIFDKNARRVSMIERYMAFSADLMTRLSSEPMINADMHEATPGTFGGVLWDKIAGPDGLGRKILGEDPAPVELTENDKKPVDAKRYAIVMKHQIGGIFLDRNSIEKTDEGCSARIVQAFDYDGEVHYGGLAMQYTYQPYVDAHYAVSTYEYSFEKLAHRLLRFTKFSIDGTVIYSIKNPNLDWITGEMDPMLPFALLTVRANLPEQVAKVMAKEVKSFDEFMKESVEEVKKEQEAKKNKEAQDKEAAK